MLALVNTPNGPAPVELRQIPDPVPAHDEALIEVRAFSLNRGELASFARNKEGWVPGQDVAGVVLKAAANGKGPAAGARVVALVDDFGWAQQVAAPSHRMAVLPDNVTFQQAATLPVAGLTALRTLRLGGSLLGQRVLVTGAAGGVGSLAVQLAVRGGAHVVAVVGHAGRAENIKAAEVIQGMQNVTGRFALILESGGGESLSRAIQLIEPRGTIVVFGNSAAQPTNVSFGDFRGAANARIQTFSYFTSEPEDRFAPDLALLVSLIADGSLRPTIGIERNWQDLLEVGEQLRARTIAGKAVFLVQR